MATNTTPVLIARRYELHERLGAGGMGAVYQATDRLTGNVIALKHVTAELDEVASGSQGGSSSDFRVALSAEFRTLASLRHPNIISVLDYGFDEEQRPYFTMDMVEKPLTLLQAARQQPLDAQVALLVELLGALGYLHHRGILHRDLKPGNVLVDGEGGVKMLDFGLSLATTYSMTNIDAGMVGTMAYMAPELFQDQKASIASDLYAVGVMIYELLTGSKPFENRNLALLINSILSNSPDLAELDEGLAVLIERLLAKQPGERHASASEVAAALCEAAGIDHPEESIAARESFLQSAPFAGRKQELSLLRQALNDALNGQGSIRLVGGESGVGKSRLLDELRIRALVSGVLVLRGQTVSEGSSPYHVWRDPLRRLALAADLTDEQASVLKPYVAEIDKLLGRQIDDAPELSNLSQVQFRLFKTVETILKSIDTPVMILLEDLHWAGSESLSLIQHIMTLVAELPLLIVGDFRDDERPDLPQFLGNPHTLTLRRLDAAAIAELSASMLGQAGLQPHVVELLRLESEGNAYFLIEVVRALAEEAGDLSQIGKQTLPQRIFAGGIQAIVERRLGRVAKSARALLQLAAIAGRRLDMAVLAALAPEDDLESWLTHCANAAVFEVESEHWQFAHNKLRERLLDDISPDERPALYRQVAQAIETAHPDDPEQAAHLAHLWQVAGDAERELYCTRQAGLQAFNDFANAEAIDYLARAIELLQSKPDDLGRARQELELRVPRSMALMFVRGFSSPEVEESWAQSRALCERLGTPPEITSVLYGLCTFYNFSGDHQSALALDAELVRIAPETEHPILTELLGHYLATTNYVSLGELTTVMESAEHVLALYDPELVPSALKVFGQNPWIVLRQWMSIALQLRGYPDQARAILRESIALAREENHPNTLSNMLSFAWIHQLLRDVETVYALSIEAKTLNAEYGFQFNQWISTPVLGWAMAQRGQIEEGLGQIDQAMSMLQGVGAAFLQNYFFTLLAEVYALSGQTDKALAATDEALANIELTNERFYEPEVYRLRGDLLLSQGASEAEAETQFQTAIKVAQEREARWLELRATVSLARLWHQQGKTAQAREQLSSIYNWFTEGFDTLDLQAAKTVLDELA